MESILNIAVVAFIVAVGALFFFYYGMKRQRKISKDEIEGIEAVHDLNMQTQAKNLIYAEEACKQDKINMRNDFKYDLVELRKLDLNQDGKRGSIAVDDHIQKLINDIDIANHKETS